MNIVVDTNVLIIGTMKSGSERRILDLIRQGKLNIVYSEDVLTEYMLAPTNMVLNANVNKTNKYTIKNTSYQISKMISKFIFEKAIKVKVTTNGSYLKDDPSDDKFINLAIDSNVKYVISVDSHLYDDIDVKNKKGENIIVISPYQFEQIYNLSKKYGT